MFETHQPIKKSFTGKLCILDENKKTKPMTCLGCVPDAQVLLEIKHILKNAQLAPQILAGIFRYLGFFYV